jgi:hypothetical protein
MLKIKFLTLFCKFLIEFSSIRQGGMLQKLSVKRLKIYYESQDKTIQGHWCIKILQFEKRKVCQNGTKTFKRTTVSPSVKF